MKLITNQKSLKTIIRNIIGILLVLSIIPPLTVGVLNVFVLLPAFFGLILLAFPLISKLVHHTGGKNEKKILRLFISLVIIAVLLIGTELICIWTNAVRQSSPADAVVIVLGAQVKNSRPTLILSQRIHAAADYLAAHPDAVCIASGGQGSDEDISEAQCIRDTLINDCNINPGRIYLEDTSVSTTENLKNSAGIIAKMNLSRNVVLVTDGFHMFRAKFLTSREGLTPFAYPAQTDRRLVFYLYVRELFGIPKSLLLDR